MEVGSFLSLAIGIATALGKLHRRSLVHKDLKPAPYRGELRGRTGAAHRLRHRHMPAARAAGMCLAICRSIVDAHGGRLWADANEPGGAVFQFTLPAGNEDS
jgi:hypothetical protein